MTTKAPAIGGGRSLSQGAAGLFSLKSDRLKLSGDKFHIYMYLTAVPLSDHTAGT